MKKILMSFLVAGLTLSFSPNAKSCGEPEFCPVRALEHAQELKLTDAQKQQLEKIKEVGIISVKAAKEIVAQDTKNVLNAKQLKKYEELKAKKKEGKCEKCGKGTCDGKSCPRGEKKDH